MALQKIAKVIYITSGWLCILLGAVGAFLPILPTTPFLLLALWLFNRSSPRFHAMMLNNPWVGSTLRQWEESKSMTTTARRRAMIMIILVFSLSIVVVRHSWQLQLMLALSGALLLLFMLRIRIKDATTTTKPH